MKKALLILMGFLALSTPVLAQDKIKFEIDPDQALDVPFRLFKTQNMWNMLLLDTCDGRIWQVQYSVKENGVRTKIPLNERPLVGIRDKKVGRYTLYPTENMWTFILLDQYDGRIWQCQFSVDGSRFIVSILSPSERAGIMDELSKATNLEYT